MPTGGICTTVGPMNDLPSMLVPLTGGHFPGWPATEAPSIVQELLVLVLIPVAIMAVVGIIALAGSLARRGRGQTIEVKEPLWLGQTSSANRVGADRPRASLAAGGGATAIGSGAQGGTTTGDQTDTTTGGTSVRW